MTLLNAADSIYLGNQLVDAVYLGSSEVWSRVIPTYSIWGGVEPPDTGITQALGDNDDVTLGTVFILSEPLQATHVRFYFGDIADGWQPGDGNPAWRSVTDVGIWLSNSPYTMVASKTIALADPRTYPGYPGWIDIAFDAPVALVADTYYTVGAFYPYGNYAFKTHYFDTGHTNGPVYAPSTSEAPSGNGLFSYAGSTISRPDGTFNAGSYFVDVLLDEA